MLVGNSAGFTLLSNDDFWDPKTIQLFEDGPERSTNKPNINDKILRYKDTTSTFNKFEIEITWMKIRIKRKKDFFRNLKK